MQKVVILFVIFLIAGNIFSQTELWGFINTDSGMIFKTDGDGNNLEIVFDDSENKLPGYSYSTLLEALDGKLYGTTNTTLFSYDRQSNQIQVLHRFSNDSLDGKTLYGGVIQASNGKLYGMTHEGGAHNGGTIYEYNPSNGTFLKIYDFGSICNPPGDLVEVAANELYGVTEHGGTNDDGFLFKIDANTHQFTKLIDFDLSMNTAAGLSTLLKASDGNLYGYMYHRLYKYNPVNNQITVLYDSLTIGVCCPYHKLVEPIPGEIYGATCGGGDNNEGLIFEYDINSQTFTPEFSFLDSVSGSLPYGRMLYTNGALYGMTYSGGKYDDGVIYKYDFINKVFSKLYDFQDCGYLNNLVEGNSLSGLIETSDGKIYGLTQSALFQFDPQNITVTSLITNSQVMGGTSHYAQGLVQGKNGNLYGVSEYSECSEGLLFEINPSTFELTFIHKFNNFTEGVNPRSFLVSATNGKLYGSTYKGGLYNYGTLFSYDVDSGSFIKLADFKLDSTGAGPAYQLTQANNGNLYGITTIGTPSLFKYNISTGKLSRIYNFNTVSKPISGLLQASDGKLYGNAVNYTTHNGNLYYYDLTNSQYVNVANLDSSLGNYSYSTPVEVDSGKLFCLCPRGGTYNYGTIIEYNIYNHQLTKVFDFDSITSGYRPYGSLIRGTNGLLYGYALGNYPNAILFSFNPNTYEFQKIAEINCSNTGIPYYTKLVEINSSGIKQPHKKNDIKIYPLPTKGLIHLENVRNFSLTIYSLTGNIVYQKNSLKYTEVINLSNFSQGLFLFRFQSKDGHSIEKKVVLQK